MNSLMREILPESHTIFHLNDPGFYAQYWGVPFWKGWIHHFAWALTNKFWHFHTSEILYFKFLNAEKWYPGQLKAYKMDFVVKMLKIWRKTNFFIYFCSQGLKPKNYHPILETGVNVWYLTRLGFKSSFPDIWSYCGNRHES